MSSILIIGGTGLLGRRITSILSKTHQLAVLSRKSAHTDANGVKHFHWNPDEGIIDAEALQSNIIVNLVGAGIVDKKWTTTRKEELIRSRVDPTMFLAQSLQSFGCKPSLYIGASAIGIYGDRGEEWIDEYSAHGSEFLSICCKKWEAAHQQVSQFTSRTLIMRIGIVLSTEGGALPQMLQTKSFGFLPYFGKGNMYYSWIHIDDIVSIIQQAMNNENYRGVINAVSPMPIVQKSFISHFLKYIAFPKWSFSVPSWLIRLLMGEMSVVVLNSQRIVPRRLLDWHYQYQFKDLDEASKDLMNK